MTGSSVFDAEGGVRSAQLIAIYLQPISEKWIGGGALSSHLVEDAADSPVTDDRGDRGQVIVGGGVGFVWQGRIRPWTGATAGPRLKGPDHDNPDPLPPRRASHGGRRRHAFPATNSG